MSKKIDIPILIITFAILLIGNLLIYSAASGGIYYMQKQIVFTCIGTVFGFLFYSLPTKTYEKICNRLYSANIIMLFLVLVAGISINGAKRWFNLGFMNLQPSELCKIFVIICLSAYLYRRRHEIKTAKTFWSSFVYVLIPTCLVFAEPDLGTSIVLISVWFTANFIMGTDIKNIIVCILIFAVLAGCVWFIPGLLKPYQKDRLVTFINPESDTLDSGYHVTQSKIAIGSGELFGKGFLKGGQRQLKFIPEQHTDFIFTVLGEEWGFLGSVCLLVLYGLLIWRLILIALNSAEFMGRCAVSGICAVFVFHLFTNIGMTLGIMPVTGLPLVLVSYGGTNLIVTLICIGIAENVAKGNLKDNFFDNQNL